MATDASTLDRRTLLATGAGLLVLGLSGCTGGSGAGTSTSSPTPTSPPPTITGTPTLDSPAFDDGSPIPTRYTCDGANVSPRLTIGEVPETAASLALVVDDPDAPNRTFTHWLIWALPPGTTTIPEGVPRGETVSALGDAIQGTNDAGAVGYSGPCPPSGAGPHTYRFSLLALDSPLDLAAGADRPAFDDALEETPRATTVLHGQYRR